MNQDKSTSRSFLLDVAISADSVVFSSFSFYPDSHLHSDISNFIDATSRVCQEATKSDERIASNISTLGPKFDLKHQYSG